MRKVIFAIILVSALSASNGDGAPESLPVQNSLFKLGVGKADITGPAAEAGMMGYADSAQTTPGIHIRLWSRAFIIEQDGKRIVFVSADLGQLFESVQQGVIEQLRGL